MKCIDWFAAPFACGLNGNKQPNQTKLKNYGEFIYKTVEYFIFYLSKSCIFINVPS